MISEQKIDWEGISHILQKSPYHKNYTDLDIKRCIEPPLCLGNYFFAVDESLLPTIFATWAFPEKHHITEYLTTNQFPANGFYGEGNVPWVIDFICIGGKNSLYIAFKAIRDIMRYELGYTSFNWYRTQTGKLGYFKSKEK